MTLWDRLEDADTLAGDVIAATAPKEGEVEESTTYKLAAAIQELTAAVRGVLPASAPEIVKIEDYRLTMVYGAMIGADRKFQALELPSADGRDLRLSRCHEGEGILRPIIAMLEDGYPWLRFALDD